MNVVKARMGFHEEANHALQSVIINSNGDGREQNTSLPWLLTGKQSNIVK
jgi:hypothetical protein